MARVNSVNENLQESVTSNTESGAQVHTVTTPEQATRGTGKLRLAVVVSHPIQHFAPWHRELAAVPGIELKVFFCRNRGAASYFDEGFGTEVKWDIPLLDGYEFEFLTPGQSRIRSDFFQIDNPTVGDALAKFRPDVCSFSGTQAGRCGGRGAGATEIAFRCCCTRIRMPVRPGRFGSA